MKFLLGVCLLFTLLLPSFADNSSDKIVDAALEDNLKARAKTYRQEGYKLQSEKDFQGALLYYHKALELQPYYVEVINDLGVIYENLGDEKAAIALYGKAIEMDPRYLPAHTNLALLYEKKGDAEKAGYYWAKRYKLEEARGYWSEVAAEHLRKLGVYPKAKKDKLEEAATSLSRELTWERNEINNRAREHFKAGTKEKDYGQALKEFETALSLNPTDEELKKQITDSYTKVGKIHFKERALSSTKEAIKYINEDDYFSAGEKLRDALSLVFTISQKEN